MNDIKLKFALPDYRDLLRCGEIESDCGFKCSDGVEKIREIRLLGILYHLKTINDEIVSLKQ